jgi:hypothetical protein
MAGAVVHSKVCGPPKLCSGLTENKARNLPLLIQFTVVANLSKCIY